MVCEMFFYLRTERFFVLKSAMGFHLVEKNLRREYRLPRCEMMNPKEKS
jgi:hypothetical protein